jgi:hypothetical protein
MKHRMNLIVTALFLGVNLYWWSFMYPGNLWNQEEKKGVVIRLWILENH